MFDKVKEMLVDNLHIEESAITLDAELDNDLGINSLEIADLILMCEEDFGIEIADEDIQKLITVGDVVEYLEAHAQ